MSFANKYGSTAQPPEAQSLTGTLRIDHFRTPPGQPAATKAFLNVIRSRADLGVHVFIEGVTTIGRDPNCTIPLHDLGVSRQHAMITPEQNGTFMLTDMRSTNGTRVNGTSVDREHVLKDGEKIYVGDTVLQFALADELEIDFHSEVATLVSTDPLTGLPSKRRFDQALEFSLEKAKRGGGSMALLMMDMDGVKQINDTHGHLFGAHVIGETGRLIDRVLGSRGRACRFGGDEFSAFMPACDLVTATTMAENIRQVVEETDLQKDGITLKPTISIGVACYPDVGQNLTELVAKADEALYRAKAQGKNCVAH